MCELTVGTGAEINGNTATISTSDQTFTPDSAVSTPAGAGINLDIGAKLNLSGNPNFGGTDVYASTDAIPSGRSEGDIKGTAGNFVLKNADDDVYKAPKNGGKAYPANADGKYLVRQDINVAGSDETLTSINVTGPITSDAGTIWVWAEYVSHYDMLKQFAVLDESLTSKDESGNTTLNTDKMTASQLENTMKAFRNARPDSQTNCGGDYLTGQKGEVITNIYWTGGFDVVFLKTDGYGVGLPGATFTLYTDEACTIPFEMTFVGTKNNGEKDGKRATTISSDGTETYKDKTGATVTLAASEVLLSKVPPKTFYMKETETPVKNPAGEDYSYVLDATVYEVKVSATGELEIHKKAEATDTEYTVEVYKAKTREVTVGTDTEDVIQYIVQNESAIKRKVILRKTAKGSYASLSDVQFRIFKADMTEVINADYNTADKCYTSLDSGVYFIDTLPEGKYYLLETGVPAGAADSNLGKVFILTVGPAGASQQELGKEETDETLLTVQTGTGENVVKTLKTFTDTVTADAAENFIAWMKNPTTP